MGRLRAGGGIAPRPKLHSGAGLFESEPAHRGRATACQGGHYSTGRQRVREHNEFGEIGLDHDLMESSNEDLVLLQSGCLCCTIRDDLAGTLRSLFLRRVKGEITEFDRVIIETTGLADPAPILHTLMRLCQDNRMAAARGRG